MSGIPDRFPGYIPIIITTNTLWRATVAYLETRRALALFLAPSSCWLSAGLFKISYGSRGQQRCACPRLLATLPGGWGGRGAVMTPPLTPKGGGKCILFFIYFFKVGAILSAHFFVRISQVTEVSLVSAHLKLFCEAWMQVSWATLRDQANLFCHSFLSSSFLSLLFVLNIDDFSFFFLPFMKSRWMWTRPEAVFSLLFFCTACRLSVCRQHWR